MTATNRIITITLDTKLDKDLILEGLAREMINRIQKTRKTLQFNVDDRIRILYEATGQLAHAWEKHEDMIKKETLCTETHLLNQSDSFSFEIEGDELKLKLEKNS